MLIQNSTQRNLLLLIGYDGSETPEYTHELERGESVRIDENTFNKISINEV